MNAWIAVEAQLALPDYTSQVTKDVRAAAALARTIGAPALSSEEAIQRAIREDADSEYKTYGRPVLVRRLR